MKQDFLILLKNSREKVNSAINLIEASLTGLQAYNQNRNYTAKELEPYDALSDRFVRAVETCIKFFNTYEYYLNAVKKETYRDLLLSMEQKNLISSIEKWIDMREIRNRIVHEYLPHEIKSIYDAIMYNYSDELAALKQKINSINFQ